MLSTKRTYALPAQTVSLFEQAVQPRQRRAVINQVLSEWLEHRRREQLRQELREGCQAMAEIYLEAEQAWHPLEEEVHCAFPVLLSRSDELTVGVGFNPR